MHKGIAYNYVAHKILIIENLIEKFMHKFYGESHIILIKLNRYDISELH